MRLFELCEIAMKLLGRCAVCRVSLFLARKSSEVFLLLVGRNVGGPLFVQGVPRYSLESAFISREKLFVVLLFLQACDSKILVSIIKRVVIDVIAGAWVSGRNAQHLSVQVEGDFLPVYHHLANRIESSMLALQCVPLHKRMLAGAYRDARKLSLRQWNLDVLWSGHPQPPKLGTERWLFAQPMPTLYLGGGES
jgi:hypothetical protein